jgi:lysozyme
VVRPGAVGTRRARRRARRATTIALLVVAVLVGAAVVGYFRTPGWLWFVSPSAERYPIRGLDVSHHQGAIDWAAVASEGWQFAWLKATEGGDWTDPRFDENRAGAARAGVRWGAYHFLTFCRDPERQAAHFLSVLGDDVGQLPPAVDVETGGNCSERPRPEELARHLGVFLERVEGALHRRMVIYVVPDQVEELFGPAGLPDRPLWVRSIFAEPTPLARRPWTIWQYHSRARIAGVGVFVDLDVFAGDARAFEAFVDR